MLENAIDRAVHTKYYLPTVEKKYYNIMINEQNFFDQPVKNNLRTYENIRKIMTCKGIDYMTSCLLKTINKCHKMIAKDLIKNKHFMLIQKQYNKLLLQEIYLAKEMQIQQCFSLFKK